MSIPIRVHKAKAGALWFKAGLQVFQTQPFVFMFMYLFIGAISLFGLIAPVLQIPLALASPFLMAGFYQAAYKKQKGEKVAFADVLNVFSEKGRRLGLFRLGLYQMGAGLLLGMVASVLFADAVSILNNPNMDPQTAMAQLAQSVSFGQVALFLLLMAVYLCAFAFAVPLVYFAKQRSILLVLKASLMAFYHNGAALTVYGLITGALMLVSAILSLLPLLVLMPICYISLFIGFQAIFMPDIDKAQREQAPPAKQTNTEHSGRFDA